MRAAWQLQPVRCGLGRRSHWRDRVTAIALNGADTEGIRNASSSPKLENVTVSAISASGGTHFGIYNATTGGSFVVRVTNSQIAGSFYTINTIPSYTTIVVASQLSGGPVGGGGSVTCVGVYDEYFVALGYTTCP